MNAYVPRPVRAEARAWVEAVPAEQLFAARWRGQPVGEWASSSALNHFRLYVPDFADPRFVRAAREVLEATVLSYEAALVVFDEHQPEVVVVMNGRFAPQRVIVEVARQRGARIITHERGAQDDTHRVVDGALIHDLGEYDRLAADWQPLALRASQLHRIDLILDLLQLGLQCFLLLLRGFLRRRDGLLGLPRGRLCQRRHCCPEWRVRCQHTKVAVSVCSRWWHQGGNTVDQFQRRQSQLVHLGATLVTAWLAM
jgi:hypothetical protein